MEVQEKHKGERLCINQKQLKFYQTLKIIVTQEQIKNEDKRKKHTMKKWTEEELKENGYEIENVQITNARLCIEDHYCLTLDLFLKGKSGSVIYGGYCLGHCYTTKPSNFDENFKGYVSGTEAIMRIMSTVGVSDFNEFKGSYVRAVFEGSRCIMIGNIIEDVWFDYESFFGDIKSKEV